jgi:hypothetical protein
MGTSIFIRCLCLLLIALAPAAEAAHAQRPPGSLLSREPREMEGREADALLNTYIGCITRNQRGKARRLLDLPYLGEEQRRLAADMMIAACINRDTRITFLPANIVGRIAELLFLERYADLDLTRFAGMSDETAEAIGLVARNNAEDLALCTLRSDPQAVRALVGTRRDSAEEAAAVQRLVPLLGPCLSAGETVDLNARALRLLLAVGLYRAATIGE